MGLDCYGIRDHFSELLDEQLDRTERAEIEAHLAACPECAREYALFQRTNGLVRELQPLEVRAGLTQAILSRVREQRPSDLRLPWIASPRPAVARGRNLVYWTSRIAAAAAVAALTVGVWYLVTHPRANSVPAPIARHMAPPPTASPSQPAPASGQMAVRHPGLKTPSLAVRRAPGKSRAPKSGQDSLYDQPYDQDLHTLPPYDSGTPVSAPADTSVHLEPATSPGRNFSNPNH